MALEFSEKTGEFHLFNQKLSYIIKILSNKQLGNLYFGKHIHHREDFSHLLEGGRRSLTVYTKEDDFFMSPQYTKMEYPCSGRGDFRVSAFEVRQENGSRITAFEYDSHTRYAGKKKLEGLPATYVELEQEAETLEILLIDKVLGTHCLLSYTIFADYPVITRSSKFIQMGEQNIILEKVMSASLDLPDSNYDFVHLSGAWARERHVRVRKLEQGVQSIGSNRGASSAEHNPFLALKRPDTNENSGEVYGFSLVYSGNHLETVEVDSHDMTRVGIGIHPDGFSWQLKQGEEFQSPEAVMVYCTHGLNEMSQTYHELYRNRLARGLWRDRERPILLNNWEATKMNFDEEKIMGIAKTGKQLGMELFVLDDGWFGARNDEKTGLGDWFVKDNRKLPDGVEGLATKIEQLGMKFGLWFEPEMVCRDSDLFRKHPDWILCPSERTPSPSRCQYVLDFSRDEVVNYIYEMMERILSSSNISYVKWDMNRYITECYSQTKSSVEQGKVFHLYILGVYRLYERLISRFPEILFESCSSGGARFDPGMLYYAPQVWTSDDTDAMERVKIQYGTSLVYPLSSMGAHVSAVPNQQVGRITSLGTRSNVAQFGVFGYEMDVNTFSGEEKEQVKKQVAFAKKYRKLVQQGLFYRIQSPFLKNEASWIVVAKDRSEALLGYYRTLGIPNISWRRIRLAGLDENKQYCIDGDPDRQYYGSELMNAGMVVHKEELTNSGGDFSSKIYFLKEAENENSNWV